MTAAIHTSNHSSLSFWDSWYCGMGGRLDDMHAGQAMFWHDVSEGQIHAGTSGFVLLYFVPKYVWCDDNVTEHKTVQRNSLLALC
jgi:hypothetical protein